MVELGPRVGGEGPRAEGGRGKVNLPPIHCLTRPTDGSADLSGLGPNFVARSHFGTNSLKMDVPIAIHILVPWLPNRGATLEPIRLNGRANSYTYIGSMAPK